MSEEEFLARWSRCKRQAKHGGDVPLPVQTAEPQVPSPSRSVKDTPETEPDLSSLPSIDSISAATDVTAFLRKGIPTELSRAALRRAWASDPAIRDFVGIAENAWNFNDPQAMPGFGPLDHSQEQLSALVDRIVGGVRSAGDSLSVQVAEERKKQSDTSRPADKDKLPLAGVSEGVLDRAAAGEVSSERALASSAAAQSSRNENENDQVPMRGRIHGGALPR